MPLGSSDFTTVAATGGTATWTTSTNLRMTQNSTQFQFSYALATTTLNSGIIIAQSKISWSTNGGGSEDIGGMKLTNAGSLPGTNIHTTVTNASITSRWTGGNYRPTCGSSSWNSYDPGSSVTQGKDCKIVYDTSNNNIKLYYWGGSSWTQFGTTQTYDILGGTAIRLVLYYSYLTNSIGNLDFDNIYFGTFASDYSTQYPPATTSIKTVLGLAQSSVKTWNGLAIASVKTINGLS
jgi:hypothetical protein